MNFTLKKPCKDCPFRKDKKQNNGWLGKERAEGIVHLLHNDRTFPCHKTTNHDDDDDFDEEYKPTGKEQHCYGALVMLKNEGTLFNNFLYRLAVIADMLDEKKINTSSPVVASSDEFIKMHDRGLHECNQMGQQHKKTETE